MKTTDDKAVKAENDMGVNCPTCGVRITIENAGGYRTFCEKCVPESVLTPRTDDFAAQKIPANDFGEPKYHVALNNWAGFCRDLEVELRMAIAANEEQYRRHMESMREQRLTIGGQADEAIAKLARVQHDAGELIKSLQTERDELKRKLGEGPARIQELQRQMDEAREANKEMGDALERLSEYLGVQGTANEIVDAAILKLNP